MSISVENLMYSYANTGMDKTKVLDDVSFTINRGSLVGVIGHTGSGKSTLMQQLNGLLIPEEGSIYFEGKKVGKDISYKELRNIVGLVFQYPEYQLFEETIEKDVAFGPSNLNLSKEEIDLRVREAINLVGLDYDEIKDRSPFELSGGQKRRVAIAGVIAMRPQVLILDEPTAGLDPMAHREILTMIKDLREKCNTTIILVSHNMYDIANMCEHILVLDKGKLIMQGDAMEVFSQREFLKSLGLDVPLISDFLYKCREKGLDVDPVKFTLNEAANELAEVLKRKIND